MKALERARSILANAVKMPVESLPDDVSIDNLPAWDSIAHVHAILALEEHLGRMLAPEAIVSLTSLRSIAAMLANQDEAADGHG